MAETKNWYYWQIVLVRLKQYIDINYWISGEKQMLFLY